ncbi:MAG: hypothetical protein AABX23_02860 [Nanoarchaeota archaeon]
MENDKIKFEAHALLDKFGKDLSKIKISNSVRTSGDLREEKIGEICDIDFKTIMFKNAKHKNDMYLLLEKGSWN